jgi:hypothetical protein
LTAARTSAQTLALPQVTLVAIDTRAPALATQSLQRSMTGIAFARVVLFTRAAEAGVLPAGIEGVPISPLASGADYSRFVLRELAAHIATSHVLVTQWDGFVVDPAAWRPEFLEWDYIGAVWTDQPEGRNVGNGGFSLRSRALLAAGRDPVIQQVHPEDAALCREHRVHLERTHGIRFAPSALARCFAVENGPWRGRSFGFHGAYHLPRLLDETTLVEWLDALPDPFFLSRDARRLARALLLRDMPQAAAELLQRRSLAGSRDPKTRALGWLARALSRIGRPAGRGPR